MQGMVVGNGSRGKPRQRWEKDITYTFGTGRYDGSSKQSGGRQASISQRHLRSDVLTMICSEKKKKSLGPFCVYHCTARMGEVAFDLGREEQIHNV